MHLWGRWIYLIDAVDDYDEDRCGGRFNPLFLADKPSSVSALLEEFENRANCIIDNLILRNYESVVHALFHTHIPHRRSLILSKVNLSEIEGNHNESSIQFKN